MNPYFAPSEAELLAHSSYLEELSRRLVTDPQSADDIVQDTWLAALESPPRHSINVSAWLGTVAGNNARKQVRTRKRQTYREHEVARPEGMPDLLDELDRTDALRTVASAVENLSEPYRTVVYLRYFENLPPREIAAQLDVGVGTIKSQLHRGLEKLREELHADFGRDGADWRGILCACFGWPMPSGGSEVPPAAAAQPSLAAFHTMTTLLILSGLLAVGFGSFWEPASSPNVVAAADSREGLERPIVANTPTERTPVSTTTPVSAPTIDRNLHLLVVDEEGSPVSNAQLWLASEQDLTPIAVTNLDGTADVPLELDDRVQPRVFSEMHAPIPEIEPRFGILATADGCGDSLLSWIEADALGNERLTIHLTQAGFALNGVVKDAEGNPLAGVRIERHEPREGVRKSAAADLAVVSTPSVESDALGRFAFDDLPVGLYWLRFDVPGFATTWRRKVQRTTDDIELEVTLQRAGSAHGFVTDPNGQPVADAIVWTQTPDEVHRIETRTTETGEFRLEQVAPGRRFLFIEGGPDQRLAARMMLMIRPDKTAEYRAQLSPVPAIRVLVVDEEDRPRPNTAVFVRIKSSTRIKRMQLTTDSEGRLEIFEPTAVVSRIEFAEETRYGTVLALPDAKLEGENLRQGEHTVVLPASKTRAGTAELRLSTHEGTTFEEVAVLARGSIDGVFRVVGRSFDNHAITVQNLNPDTYELALSCTGLGHMELPSVEVTPGAELDLGELVAPEPGKLRIEWNREPGKNESLQVIQFLRAPNSKPLVLQREISADPASASTYPLLPGEYGLRISTNGELKRVRAFTIRPGFETLVLLDATD